MVTIQAVGGASAKGTRPYQQDTYTVLPPDQFLPNNNNLAFFAVYDGHGTEIVSKHASENLRRLLSQTPELQSGDYENAIKRAISEEEKLIMQEFKHGEADYVFAGSTVALVVLDLERGVIVTGNVGDSKVILGVAGEGDGVEDVKCLTKSHKPANPDEKHRIEDAGGTVTEDMHEIPRIGALNMSRALGDLQYKTPFTNLTTTNPQTHDETPLTEAQARAGVEPSKEQGDFLSSEPDIARTTLDKGKKYVLALVTDGVSDSPKGDKRGVLGILGGGFGRGIRGDAVVKELVEGVTERVQQSDNATCVGVLLG